MDSGNMTETLGEGSQPADSVVLDAETTEDNPQSEATEETELYVDVEGDQQQQPNSMDERQTKAAWKEEKRKRLKRTAEAKAEKERADKLEEKVKTLESQVNNVTRGHRPDPYDFDSKEEFYKADEIWQSHGNKPAQQQDKQPVSNQVVLSDDQEWHLHQSEDKLRKSFKDYDDVKGRVDGELKRAFGVASDYPIAEEIAKFAHTFDVDPAKVFYALDKMPGKIDELVKHAQNSAQIGRILRDLDSKIKMRERKPIGSKPEPKINGGGPVNMLQKEVDKAREAYIDKPTQRNHQLLTAARKRVKDSK